jgi:hypothetical protein
LPNRSQQPCGSSIERRPELTLDPLGAVEAAPIRYLPAGQETERTGIFRMTIAIVRLCSRVAMMLAGLAGLAAIAPAAAQDRLLVDTHIHYSHDAWEELPPRDALKVLREAGLERAFVSSSSDEGTQKLYALAPQFIVPVLRPYRKRGELSSWMHDETVIGMLETKLAANPYAGIGEFHVFGADADLPVLRKVVELAGRFGIFLHVHGDTDAVERLFAQDPDIRILWAHSGFTGPKAIRRMLEKYGNLQADLAFRGEFAQGEKINPSWRKLFLDFPDRFMIGTDTYTPERWYAVSDNAAFSRDWMNDLPDGIAAKIGRENAIALADQALANWAAKADAAGRCDSASVKGAIQIRDENHSMALMADPADIMIGNMFGADILACRSDGSFFDGEIALSAIMPAHGHGMNTAAEVTRIAPGRFRAEGLMFHMPGLWRFQVQYSDQESDGTLEADVTAQ